MRTLLRCLDLGQLVGSAPHMGLALVLVLFAAAATILQVQPFQFRWVHWAWSEPTVYWVSPTATMVWQLPRRLAFGVMLAMLPVGFLAAAHGWRPRRLAVAFSLAAGTVLLLNGWIAPMSDRERSERFWTSHGRTDPYASHPLVYATTGRLVALTADLRPPIARDARDSLKAQVAPSLNVMALGLLGAALGRARVLAQSPVGLRLVAGWWVFTWIAYRLLEYWSVYLRVRSACRRRFRCGCRRSCFSRPRLWRGWRIGTLVARLKSRATKGHRYHARTRVPLVPPSNPEQNPAIPTA